MLGGGAWVDKQGATGPEPGADALGGDVVQGVLGGEVEPSLGTLDADVEVVDGDGAGVTRALGPADEGGIEDQAGV